MSNNMLDRLKSIRNEFFDLIQDVRRSNGKSKLTSTEQEVDQIDWVCLDVDLGHPILQLGFDLPGSLPPFLAVCLAPEVSTIYTPFKLPWSRSISR